MDRFWIVVMCTKGVRPLRCGKGYFKQHATEELANAECDRLSIKHPKKIFCVFESKYAALTMCDETPVDKIEVAVVI